MGGMSAISRRSPRQKRRPGRRPGRRARRGAPPQEAKAGPSAAGPPPAAPSAPATVAVNEGGPEGEAGGAPDLQRRIEDLSTQLLYLQSDIENVRRRADRERVEAGGRATADLCRRLLEVLDGFDQALN